MNRNALALAVRAAEYAVSDAIADIADAARLGTLTVSRQDALADARERAFLALNRAKRALAAA